MKQLRELSYACFAQQQRTRQTISVRPTWDILNDRFCSFLPGCKKGMEIRSMTSTYNIFDIESDRCPWWSSLRLIRGSRIESELNSKRGSTFRGIFRQIQKITFTRNFGTFFDFKLSPIIRRLNFINRRILDVDWGPRRPRFVLYRVGFDTPGRHEIIGI